MRAFVQKAVVLLIAGALAGGTTFGSAETASAQGLFETLFGGLRRLVERPERIVRAPDLDHPFNSFARAVDEPNLPRRAATGGPARGFCVRTCDGRYFPIQARGTVSAADMCRAFCPAGETRIYSGSDIDYAVATDGSRYADLGTAFLYRERLVGGCTCNGRDAYGLAHIDVKEDPTLKPGDVVVTRQGVVAYTGKNKDGTKFTPVQSYNGLSKGYRETLSELKLMPPNPGAPNKIVSSIGQSRPRSAQLDR